MKARTRGFTLIELMIVFAILAVLLMLVLPNFVRARSNARLSSCDSNLRNLSAAVSLYANDNDKRFPDTLDLVTPHYIKAIPSCPSAGSDTYSEGFGSRSNPDNFTIFCKGSFHVDLGVAQDHPQIYFDRGLVEGR